MGSRKGKRRGGGSTRRVFVQRLALVGGGTVLLGGGCKKGESTSPKDAGGPPKPLTTRHRVFTDEEFRTLSAACERVLPKDEDPGALDANVPEYIDRILTTVQLKKMRTDFVPGLAALDRRAQRMFKVPFAEAAPAQQDELLAIFKDSPERSGEARWFELLMVLSLEGFLGDPSYGGNRGKVGWALMGFKLVGGPAVPPAEGYDGSKTLDALTCAARGC